MEQVDLLLNQPDAFDTALHGHDGVRVLADGGDLRIITKDGAMMSGRAGCILTFTVDVDGKLVRAQTVVPVRQLVVALKILAAHYDEDGRPRRPADAGSHEV